MTNNEIAKKILQITRTGYYEDQLDKIVKLLESSKPFSGELPPDFKCELVTESVGCAYEGKKCNVCTKAVGIPEEPKNYYAPFWRQ